MINTKYLQLIRSYNRFDINNFIFNKIAERITDSLDLLNIEIKHALEIGINENLTFDYLKSRFIKSLAYHFDIPIMEVNLATGKIDDEGMKFLLKLSGTGLRIMLLDEFDTIKHVQKTKSMTGVDDKKESMKDLSKAGWNNLLDSEAYDSLIVVWVGLNSFC